MNARNNYGSSEETSDRELQRRRRYRWDTVINWTLFALIAMIGFWIVETDVDTYQSERLSYRMLRDGVTVEEAAENPYMQQGMIRNMQYKDATPMEFFMAKWKWRIPVYIFCIILPILVSFLRVRSRNRGRWNWAYIPLTIMSLGYWVYFMGRWMNKW